MIEPARDDVRGLGWRLFALSFAALFLELMLIRWVPAVVRLVAYYANLMLISSFLGLGLGAMISTRGWRTWRWFFPLIALEIGLVLACRYVAMPAGEHEVRFYGEYAGLINYLVLVALFIMNTLVFVPLGEQIGALFHRLPTLRAYSWDLCGSLCGTLAFAAFSLLAFSPVVGIAIVLLITLMLAGRKGTPMRAALTGVVLVAVALSTRSNAIWSPYYYILVDDAYGNPAGPPPADIRTMKDPPGFIVRVNQDFYQGNGTFRAERYAGGTLPPAVAGAAVQYNLPHRVRPGAKRVLVLGAGGGVDVEAALLAGAEHVDAVEIDPALVRLGRKYNASGVYDDPRVTVHVDDGRAFMERSAGNYDLVVFGFLDSQALFSYGNSVRLDGFIYTVESFRRAYGLLSPDGLMSLSFAAPRPWVGSKLANMLEQATGVKPIVYRNVVQHILLTPRGQVPASLPQSPPYRLVAAFPRDVTSATDDWPYLYLQGRGVPTEYVLVIGTLLALSFAAVVMLRGRTMGTIDGHFFFLGLGFLLLQAKSIGDCALYFGATWLVTSIVIAGVLLMVLAANLLATRLKRASLWWYVPLLASLALLTFTPREVVLGWTYAGRLAWALLIVPLPIFFAGLIFSTTFRDATVPSAVFGANLIGATVGGFAEYLGMALGTRALWWVIIASYGASFLCRLARTGRPAVPAAETFAPMATAGEPV